MEFIKAEEFLKQDKEVQKVFLDWWEPRIGDIYAYEEKDFKDYAEVECITSKNVIRLVVKNKNDKVPLLTEGELRKFIEDKTGCFINAVSFKTNTRVDLVNVNKDVDGFFERELYHLHENHDLLQAYWKVALEIAKGEAKNADTM